MRFRDRSDAGRHLAGVVQGAGVGGSDAVVLGLPRGGVPVAFEVAQALGAPLDVIVVRKLGVPFQPELAMGAIGEDGVRVVNEDVVHVGPPRCRRHGTPSSGWSGSSWSGGRGATAVTAPVSTCVVAGGDRRRRHRHRLDGRAACQVARAQGASRRRPRGARRPARGRPALRDVCDELLCVAVPDPFFAVGEWYDDFSPRRTTRWSSCWAGVLSRT